MRLGRPPPPSHISNLQPHIKAPNFSPAVGRSAQQWNEKVPKKVMNRLHCSRRRQSCLPHSLAAISP